MRPRPLLLLFGILGILAWFAAAQSASRGPEYAAPETCATCHRQIWETYRRTGMGRSFYRPSPATVAATAKPFYHRPSDSYFQVVGRGGKYFERRYQLDPAGRQINVLEKQIDYVLGSGNHARTYLNRTARGTLVELPLGWYAEKGGYEGMNPGYDRPDHEGFRRAIPYDCMFCHNAYPKIPAEHERPFAEAVYDDPLPSGIDCQRCHGPGLKHARLAQTAGAKPADVRAAIVNPARLSPQRREEVCIQCHLESTSFPLPNSLARYDRGPFAYRPGEPLSDSWLFFDHAPGSGRGDKYELVNAVYRLRKSKCFLESKGALGCTTCHDPHDVPRGAAAARHYDAVCRRCHASAFDRTVAAGRHPAATGCADCHMPKRRTEDVVHVVATDHLIQRRKPAGDLLAEIPERHETGAAAYRGEVVLYYPEKLSPTAENELYLALAQVVDKSNLAGGIGRLSAAIERDPSARPEFYFQLAEAWRNDGQLSKALPLYREAVKRDPEFALALAQMGSALRRSGQPAEAADALKRAVAAAPDDPQSWHELGLTDRAQGKLPDAATAFEKAIALDPDLAEAHSNFGILRMASGDRARAEAEFREAIRLQPDYADAHNNLANLLSAAGDFEQARRHFEIALRLEPNDAPARYDFAMALGRARRYDEAQQQLEECLRADPKMADAHLLLAQLLLAKGETQNALPHLRSAAASGDPAMRERAVQLLRQLGQ